MKRFIVLLVLLSFFSCKSKIPVFEIYQEVNFVIPSGKDPYQIHHFLIHDIPSFLNANLEKKDLKLSNLTEFYAGRGKLESIVYNSEFGVFSKISIWVYKKGDYNNRFEIYYHDQIPFNSKGELKLLSTGEDVREILSNDEYEMDIEVQFRRFTNEVIETRLTFGYVAYLE